MIETLNKEIEKLNLEWNIHPFPHVVIDNFLSEELFLSINKEFQNAGGLKNIKKNFSTYLELNKKVYGDKDLTKYSRYPVDILGGNSFIKLIQKFIGDMKVISLSEWENYGGYYPFHSMNNEGVLGSHVDHSHSKYGDLHIANAIYYCSPTWEKSWGGETLLFDQCGLNIIKKIEPLPNRLIIFIHSAVSFHGVNKISSPSNIQRLSYYMDYYINDINLEKILNNLKHNNFKKVKYSYHGTCFIPFFPLGVKSFRIKNILKKSNYFYLLTFLKYLFNTYVFNKMTH
ncbi:MAG: hypothetical protein CFH15_00663 [Alphaproteobacteria bacterium MarineAlpha5_Bin5]|nr:MAG: hypothetical protein CFH15_00663 [Alphaproteobacteria bacterium MarineAlpha5_Bin5]PPR52531.1 MAG: hypothetical protein CFH14_00289 [Alphaproteobacteria bacterium MarineAlpha5_Bin4]|tara:strand:- start:1338 stop:2195 length:858 start_codon:yes stop_codon:yes gene_type:complete